MARTIRTYLTALLISGIPVLQAQQSRCQKAEIVVEALDKEGNFVSFLKSADFRTLVDGIEVPVRSVSNAGGAARVVFVLDKRGSMESPVKQKVAQAIATELVRTSPGGAEFAVIGFGDDVFSALGFGHTREEVLSRIKELAESPNKGKGALYDALLSADQMLRPPRPGDSVVVLGHGDDSHSKGKLKDVEHAYEQSESRIFLIEMLDDYFPGNHIPLTDTRLDAKRLALNSGGDVRSILYTDEWVSAVAESIEKELWDYYVLEIGPIQKSAKPVKLKVELEKTALRKKDTKLAYIEQFSPCP
jgi:hypothetical protein